MIRPGTPEDAEAVARVNVETWQAAYAHALPSEQLQALSVGERAGQWRSRPPLVAEVAGTIVGFVSVGVARDNDADGELYAIYVHPDHWGEGIGQALIAAGEERLRELGHDHAILWVLEDNPRARRFYELAGWRTDGARKAEPRWDVSAAEVRYRKRLV